MEYIKTEYFDVIIDFLFLLLLFSKKMTKSVKKYYLCLIIAIFSSMAIQFLHFSNYMFLWDIAISAVLIFLILTEKWYEKIGSFILIYILTSLFYQCIALILDFIFRIPIFVGMNGIAQKNTTKIVAIILLLVLLFIKCRTKHQFSYSILNKIYLSFYTGLLCIILTFFHLNYKGIESRLLTLSALLCLISACILFSYLILTSEHNVEREKHDIQDKYTQMLKSYYAEVKKNNMELRKLKHDIKNHIHVLDRLIHSGNLYDAQNYIESLNGHVTEKCIALIETGNVLTNAILLQKQSEYPSIEIDYSGIVSAQLYIDDFDYCTILGNLLDNALEYSSLNGINKIGVYLFQDTSVFLIKITNQLIAPICLSKFGKYTTKTQANHGYGINNIKEAAISYNGSLEYEQNEDLLIAKVILYCPT